MKENDGSLWFVAGTDTDAGKTVSTAGLLFALQAMGEDSQAIKAVQTGCARRSDGTLSAPDMAVYESMGITAAAYTPFRFEQPCSPHLAARQEGRPLSMAAVRDAVCALASLHRITLVEGAGGLLVPLDERDTMADLIRELGAHVILVAANRLGAINETLLSLEVAASRGLSVKAVILSSVSPPGLESGLEEEIRRDNIEIIRKKAAPVPVLGLDHISGLNNADATMRGTAWGRLAGFLKPIAEAILKAAGNASPRKYKEDLEFDSRHVWHPYAPTHPSPILLHVSSTSGNRIRLSDRRELVDGMSSWWAAIHGYNHPRLLAALHRQADILPHVMFGGLTHGPAVELGRKLVAMAPTGLDRVFFADSGSVAVEVAMKMALQYHQARGETLRTKFIAPRGGYHGDTQGAMSVCDPVTGMHGLFSGTLAKQLFVQRPASRFGGEYDPKSAREVEDVILRHGREIAAFIVEPIVQATGGMWFYHPEYLRDVRKICDEHGVLLILDEIATGFGKTGKLFACEWANVVPDIICLGKALTGGVLTLSAVMARDSLARTISEKGVFMHGPTFMANPLACAVAGASLDLLCESDWRGEVNRLERALRRGLEPCRKMPGVTDVRVLGGIGVVEMERPVNTAKLQKYFVDRGVWIRPFAKLMYLMPPFVTSDGDAAVLSSAIVGAIEQREWV